MQNRWKVCMSWYNCSNAIRAFLSRLLKNLAFTISKPIFINTPLYNIPYIKTSIFLTLNLNILSLSFFILPLSFSVSLSSVSLFHNLAPPATISTHLKPHQKPQNQRITKSQQRPKITLINPHPAPKATRSTHEPNHWNQEPTKINQNHWN